MSLVASAPGKLVLAGEYVVLEGARAIVTAVDLRVRLRSVPEHMPVPPEVVATRALAEAAYGACDGGLSLDVRALRGETKKLGLGSSAAAAAATVAMVARLRGRDTTATERFALAMRGHASVAPRGSGIDVAASVHGGTLFFRIEGETRHVAAATLPASVHAVVVYTGEEARTSDFVRAIDALQKTPRERAMAPLRAAAADCVAAFEADDAHALIAAVRAHHDAMDTLGREAGVPIVEKNLAAIAARATRFGGAAKPSGAGGGDVAVAFFDAPDRASAFAEASRAEGHAVVDVALGAEGARIDQATHGALD